MSTVLIVDDDGPMMYETYIQDALTDAGYYPYTLSPYTDGAPDYAMLSGFYAVFWTTASRDALTIGANEEQALMDNSVNAVKGLIADLEKMGLL